jgi:hypothetical protein
MPNIIHDEKTIKGLDLFLSGQSNGSRKYLGIERHYVLTN